MVIALDKIMMAFIYVLHVIIVIIVDFIVLHISFIRVNIIEMIDLV